MYYDDHITQLFPWCILTFDFHGVDINGFESILSREYPREMA